MTLYTDNGVMNYYCLRATSVAGVTPCQFIFDKRVYFYNYSYMNLRDYQLEMLDRIEETWSKVRSVMVLFDTDYVECRDVPSYSYAVIIRQGKISNYTSYLPKDLDKVPDLRELGLKR